MTLSMKEVAIKALEFQRNCVKDDKNSLAHGAHYKEDGTCDIYAFAGDCMSDYRNKNMLAAMMMKQLIAQGGTFAFCSDAWVGRLPKDKNRKDMPDSLADWPEEYRGEVLICCVNKIGERGICATQFYKRVNGEIITEEIAWPDDSTGRFVFDLTGNKIDMAVTEALLRTNEGISGLN